MRTLISCFGACVAALLVTGLNTALATSLVTTSHALNNGAGPSAGVWQGSQNYSGALVSDTLNADVEFAVFAPGSFQDFLDENGINFVDPAPTELIYAYQIVNVAAGTSGVATFTVGLQGNESPGLTGVTFIPAATNHGTYPLVPTQDPSSPGGGPGVDSSSAWPFGAGLLPGGISAILYYSSPQIPELGFSTVLAGLAGQFPANSMPNPVPEPATVVMCLAAGLALVARRRR